MYRFSGPFLRIRGSKTRYKVGTSIMVGATVE